MFLGATRPKARRSAGMARFSERAAASRTGAAESAPGGPATSRRREVSASRGRGISHAVTLAQRRVIGGDASLKIC
jgi:hypothetical protein